jgi:hypothetical protein
LRCFPGTATRPDGDLAVQYGKKGVRFIFFARFSGEIALAAVFPAGFYQDAVEACNANGCSAWANAPNTTDVTGGQ